MTPLREDICGRVTRKLTLTTPNPMRMMEGISVGTSSPDEFSA